MKNLLELLKGGLPMTVELLLTVLSFGLTCFGLGYAIGQKDSNTQK
jgi:hypothetical protein